MKKSTIVISGIFAAFFSAAIFMNKLQAGNEVRVSGYSQVRDASTLLMTGNPAVLCGSVSSSGQSGINGALLELQKVLGHDFDIKQISQQDGQVCSLITNKTQL
ncbi:MAG: hypothetical protein KA116_02085 [Proteobacteria bacterium]|jgi:hypothetical protein|nr:hypothetical protein [Pseudomonadota bacterium]